LRVAFNNLIDNACKYSPEHSCSVNVTVNSNNLHIDFTNTGVTIAQEDYNIFLSLFTEAKIPEQKKVME
jgi:K+-sensing histidine kinase KdpD